MQRRDCLKSLFIAPLVTCGSTVFANQEPPLRLLVAGPPGGSADIVARLLAHALASDMGRAVVVEPKPGGAGMVAVNALLSSTRDGNTLLVGVNSLVSEIPHIVKVNHDLSQVLVPMAELARSGLVLIAHPSVPAKNLKELIAYARTRPGQLSYASYSAGTLSHVLGLQLNAAAGIDLMHVPYRGSTPALVDVVAGHVPLMFDGLATALPMIRSGKVKAFAVSSPQRTGLLPDVPTFAEQGFPQLSALGWMGLWAPEGVPASVTGPLTTSVLATMNQLKVREGLSQAGFEPGSALSTAGLRAGLRNDFDRIGALLRAIGFTPE
jgi:tripartite-type tricarboxylate transporter receptor subunit TctC